MFSSGKKQSSKGTMAWTFQDEWIQVVYAYTSKFYKLNPCIDAVRNSK